MRASGRTLLVLKGHTAPLISAAFSPDSSTVVTCLEDHTARVWDACSGEMTARLEGQTPPGQLRRVQPRWPTHCHRPR